MDRETIIRTLKRMAFYLELGEASAFEVMAFRNGAESLEEWKGDLEQAARDETLRTIPGIGKTLARVIGDLVREGRSQDFDELRSRYPERLLELRYVSGLGVKKIKRLHTELGVGSLDDLETAARDESIRVLKGFGKKTEETILAELPNARRRLAERRPL
ncbi:MAG: hypothetical protein H6834_08705 [Planctomycetes bacterium]|nr:hypothetical protein [Planctomycetota bacterium]